ncbi:MAG: hypothetical protein Q8L47_01180 [bacterium]|nr:hypothetical protein [bacterium]
MKYQYISYLPEDITGKFIRRPMVVVDIFGPKGKHRELALIDSGADRTLINIEIASVLGIDLSRAKRGVVTGVTGQQEIFVIDVELQPEQLSKIKISVSFIKSDFVGVLLGEDGFFDTHKIKFEKDHNAFEITSVKK